MAFNDVGTTGKLADDNSHLVTDEFRVDVLVGVRMALHGGHMHTRLVGESTIADVSHLVVGGEIRHIGDEVSDFVQADEGGPPAARAA